MRSFPVFSSIEPLESRIAPAATIGLDQYLHAGIYSTDPTKTGSYSSDNVFGANFVGGSYTYYMKLVAGDMLNTPDNTGAFNDTLLQVKTGAVIAFFTDLNHDGKYTIGELTGLSVSKNASLVVNGSVNGDIVGNLDYVPNHSDTQDIYQIRPTSLIGVTQGLGSLTIQDAGSIIFGGRITKLTGNTIGAILSGTAANNIAYDFNSSDTGGGATLSVVALDKQAGPGIDTIRVTKLEVTENPGTPNEVTRAGVIWAGDGGAGAVGGSLSNITITDGPNGMLLHAGNGGSGHSVVPVGGAGGMISKIYVQGTDDSSANSPGVSRDNSSTPSTFVSDSTVPAVQIVSGKGGDAFLSQANGGAGGKIDTVYVGYQIKSGVLVKSANLLSDSVLVQAGSGGIGKVGGAGGSVNKASIVTVTPNAPTPFYEIQVSGGTGGANLLAISGGKAGAGGSLTNIDVRDINPAALSSDVLLAAGDAGISLSSGANGGSISNVTLTAYDITVQAGIGSDGHGSFGKTAGAGGSLAGISVPVSFERIHPGTLRFESGHGGDADAGNGGAGGGISNVAVDGVDLTDLHIIAGYGGKGSLGKGGQGGGLTNINVVDHDYTGTITGNATINSGKGGDGSVSGGAGGAILSTTLAADDLSFVVVSGNGGNGGNGLGGAGGKITNSSFNTWDIDLNGGADATGSVTSGTGGNGSGAKVGGGGAGGDMTQVTVAADGSAYLEGGSGGTGTDKVAGRGASLNVGSVLSRYDAAEAFAGNAGAAGALPGAGGSIIKSSIIGSTDISILAGNGTAGGAGGSILNSGYSTPWSMAPSGTVTVMAGDGSAGDGTAGKTAAGAGGSINLLGGFAGQTGITKIYAGKGAGNAVKSSAGGSILNLSIHGGGGWGQELQIQAGDAGDSSGAATGAKGGDVKGVTVEQLDYGTIFRYIVAGDGGQGKTTGGLGGSIDNVSVAGGSYVSADIGVRDFTEFGYDEMGGLFAGMGGKGGTKWGLAGNVTNITADSIAAIVAGKLQNGQEVTVHNLVTKVDQIHLNDSVTPKANPDGSYSIGNKPTDWNNANIVGAIVNPTAANAGAFDSSKYNDVDNSGTFSFGDQTNWNTDGFVAAISYPTNGSNFAPQAILTVDASGNSLFIDNN